MEKKCTNRSPLHASLYIVLCMKAFTLYKMQQRPLYSIRHTDTIIKYMCFHVHTFSHMHSNTSAYGQTSQAGNTLEDFRPDFQANSPHPPMIKGLTLFQGMFQPNISPNNPQKFGVSSINLLIFLLSFFKGGVEHITMVPSLFCFFSLVFLSFHALTPIPKKLGHVNRR